MKLLETYSLATGLKINEPFIYKAFYPLPFQNKYITIHASSGMQSKNYSFWNEVVELISGALAQEGIAMIQLGGEKDEPIQGCFHLQGALSLNQTAYILSNSLCHLCNDTFSAHVAGHFGIPLVSIYGPTTVKNHSPYKFNPTVTKFIESDRGGHLPSFASEEKNKSIDLIKPEEIANAFLSMVDGKSTMRESLHFGKLYTEMVVEYVPNFILPKDTFANGIVNVRMDYEFNEQNFARVLSERKLNVITNAPIRLDILLMFKRNIGQFSYEVSLDTDETYINQVKSLGINLVLIAKKCTKQELSDLRLKFFNYSVVEEQETTKNDIALKDKIGYNTFYKSNKFLLSSGKTFASKSDWLLGKPMDANKELSVVDCQEFWEELNHFYIYNK